MRDLDVRKYMVAYMAANGGRPPPRRAPLLQRVLLCFLPRSCGENARLEREARDRILTSKLNWSGLHDIQKKQFVESNRAVGLHRPSSVALTAIMQQEMNIERHKQSDIRVEQTELESESDDDPSDAMTDTKAQYGSDASRARGATVAPSG